MTTSAAATRPHASSAAIARRHRGAVRHRLLVVRQRARQVHRRVRCRARRSGGCGSRSVLMAVIVVVTRRWPSWTDIRRASCSWACVFGFNICVFFITLAVHEHRRGADHRRTHPGGGAADRGGLHGRAADAGEGACARWRRWPVWWSRSLTAPAAADESTTSRWATCGPSASLLVWVVYLLQTKRVRRDGRDRAADVGQCP